MPGIKSEAEEYLMGHHKLSFEANFRSTLQIVVLEKGAPTSYATLHIVINSRIEKISIHLFFYCSHIKVNYQLGLFWRKHIYRVSSLNPNIYHIIDILGIQ